LLHLWLDHQPANRPRTGALTMALDPAQEAIVPSNPLLDRLFKALPIAPACDLHQRLQAGRTDPETRTLLRRALALSQPARTVA
jgi:hypothetical protein